MLDIEPGQSKIVTLSIPSSLRDSGSFIFIPNANKLNYNIQNSLHEYNENNKFTTIIENNSYQKIRIRKKTKIGVIQKFHEEDIVEPTYQIGQVNTISLEKVKRMRKEELNPNQFNLNHLNELAQPIFNLTKKNSEFIWDQNCQDAFNKFQDMMLTKPTLKNVKHNEKLYLIMDASKVAVCGILMQKFNGKFVPIEFYSKQLNPAEMRYPSIRRELYAIFLSVKHFSEHLYGREFSILTEAKPLSHHIHLDKQPDIVARWLLYFQSFSYSIEHVPGFSNPADFLTRVQEETHVNNLNIFSIPNGMNYNNIKSHQQNDKETKEIIDKINDKNNAACKYYYMDNNSGLLMIKIKPRIKHLRNKHIENKIVIPKSLVKTCLESAHGPHFDHYSRFLEAIPQPNITSSTIIKALNQYFARFGIPKIILRDNGTNLRSNEIDSFFFELQIEHRKTSIYFPQSNGTCERSHRSLKESIAALSEQVYEWSDCLLYFKLHYNNSIHSVTQFSPAQLFFGRDLATPIHSYETRHFGARGKICV
ncbi:Transposon Tf2-8 polyprotein [Araneus ventricosus]|uniref:Transposon Tf2-8 polyprotein n=1 Tax=Araneus ventricosus TaxID=182803 RepID=A0A4Y2HFD7_ARAVE|nr:Transposon Tf2-8 polyprotein [Araneus ventricosus]